MATRAGEDDEDRKCVVLTRIVSIDRLDAECPPVRRAECLAT